MSNDRSIRAEALQAVGRFYVAHPAASMTSLMLLLICPFRGHAMAAKRLGISRATVETHVDYLRTAGYLRAKEQPVPKGKRGRPPMLYHLTDQGRALFARAARAE